MKSSNWILPLLLLLMPAVGAANLVSNADFDTDIADWSPDIHDTSTIEWSELDIDGSSESGSVVFSEDGTVPPSSVRFKACVPVDPETPYDVWGWYFIPTQADSGSAYMYVQWFLEAACINNFISQSTPIYNSLPVDEWAKSEYEALLSPVGSVSAYVYFGASNASGGTFVTHWDRVYVPEPGSTYSSLSALVTLAALAVGRARGGLKPRRQLEPHRTV